VKAGRGERAWTLRRLAKGVAIGCVALGIGAGLVYGVAHQPEPPAVADAGPPPSAAAGRPRPADAGAPERALLSPLVEGAALGDFEVKEMHAVGPEGILRVVCRKGRAVVRLDVALLGEEGPEPPAVSGRYAIFYSLRNASPEEGELLARALAEVLKKNEEAVAAPPGIGTFVAKPRELPPI
jgi:hypothetical protein